MSGPPPSTNPFASGPPSRSFGGPPPGQQPRPQGPPGQPYPMGGPAPGARPGFTQGPGYPNGPVPPLRPPGPPGAFPPGSFGGPPVARPQGTPFGAVPTGGPPGAAPYGGPQGVAPSGIPAQPPARRVSPNPSLAGPPTAPPGHFSQLGQSSAPAPHAGPASSPALPLQQPPGQPGPPSTSPMFPLPPSSIAQPRPAPLLTGTRPQTQPGPGGVPLGGPVPQFQPGMSGGVPAAGSLAAPPALSLGASRQAPPFHPPSASDPVATSRPAYPAARVPPPTFGPPPIQPPLGGIGSVGAAAPTGFAQPPPSFGAPPPFGSPPPATAAPLTQMMGNLGLGAPPGPPSSGLGAPPPPSQTQPQPNWQQAGMPGGSLAPPPPPIGGRPVAGRPAPFTGQPAGGVSSAPGSRIDPNQIPRPQPQPLAPNFVFETRVGNAANFPPSATSVFSVRDAGNCSPKMMRSTLNMIPCSSDLLSTSAMPLALMVQPMGTPGPQDTPIQVVDFGEMGPVRCSRCKGYINPFVRFVDHGRRFICNLCGCTNDTPQDYVCNLGPDGQRRDVDERPELKHGSVELVAPKEYSVRDPMPPVLFFVVDVSLNAVGTGATASACTAIKQVLEDVPYPERTRVGLATFNSSIHFYSLNPAQQQPSIMIVPEIEDVYTPLPSDLVVPLAKARDRLESVLDMIPGLYSDTKIADSCFGAAVLGGFLAVKEMGGKVVVFQSVLPSVGVGSLSSRETDGRMGSNASEKEVLKLLQPADKAYRTMATEFANNQVCVDVFLTSQSYCDAASLAVIPRFTGGQLYMYFPFNALTDSVKLYNDLRWSVVRAQGLEAILRVRCSSGLTVTEYQGNFNMQIPSEIYLPAVDCDKTLMVRVKHEDKLQDNSEAYFQCAMLYTTTSGERRIRLHNLALSTTTSLATVFRGADLDSQATFFLKKAAMEVANHSVQTVRESAITSCINVLYAYRKFCASASSSGQLILPEALKLLPLYTLACNKGLGLRTDAKVDERAYWIARVRSIPPALAVPLVYPRLYALHTAEDGAEPQKEEGGPVSLPPALPLSSERLEVDAVLLLENGEDAVIWVGKAVSPDTLHALFGARSADDIPAGPFFLQEFENPLSKRANEIVNAVRQQRSSYLRMRLVKRGDPSEGVFLSHLVEDRSSAGMSYVEFLVYVHRQIQNKMS